MENNKISNFLDIKNVSQLINEIEKQDITARDKMHLIKELEKFPDFLNNMDWGDDEYFSSEYNNFKSSIEYTLEFEEEWNLYKKVNDIANSNISNLEKINALNIIVNKMELEKIESDLIDLPPYEKYDIHHKYVTKYIELIRLQSEDPYGYENLKIDIQPINFEIIEKIYLFKVLGVLEALENYIINEGEKYYDYKIINLIQLIGNFSNSNTVKKYLHYVKNPDSQDTVYLKDHAKNTIQTKIKNSISTPPRKKR